MIIHLLIIDELSGTKAFNYWILEVDAEASGIKGQSWGQARLLK